MGSYVLGVMSLDSAGIGEIEGERHLGAEAISVLYIYFLPLFTCLVLISQALSKSTFEKTEKSIGMSGLIESTSKYVFTMR